VLEAMATGRAIITTDAPGCRETVIDGENGFLVPVRDAPALAKAMATYIDKPELAVRHGARSREIAVETYDVREVNRTIFRALHLN
jgi:glycosyltransferase involved in cell wall biosynthesis